MSVGTSPSPAQRVGQKGPSLTGKWPGLPTRHWILEVIAVYAIALVGAVAIGPLTGGEVSLGFAELGGAAILTVTIYSGIFLFRRLTKRRE